MHLGKRHVQHLLAAQRIDLRQRSWNDLRRKSACLSRARSSIGRVHSYCRARLTLDSERLALPASSSPDVDALAFGVERVGVGGQRDDFGLAVVADSAS